MPPVRGIDGESGFPQGRAGLPETPAARPGSLQERRSLALSADIRGAPAAVRMRAGAGKSTQGGEWLDERREDRPGVQVLAASLQGRAWAGGDMAAEDRPLPAASMRGRDRASVPEYQTGLARDAVGAPEGLDRDRRATWWPP